MKDESHIKDNICRLYGAPNWYFLEYCHECHKAIMEDCYYDELSKTSIEKDTDDKNAIWLRIPKWSTFYHFLIE